MVTVTTPDGVPPVAPVTAEMDVGLKTVKLAAVTLAIVTAVAPEKLVPVMITVVPPEFVTPPGFNLADVKARILLGK